MAELSRPIDREFNVEVEGGRFSTSFLNDLVDTHVNKIAPRYVKFQKLYEGKHKIQNRPRKDKNKPNNKLVNDFFGQTIDNTVGYFLGNPIVLNYTEPKKDRQFANYEFVEEKSHIFGRIPIITVYNNEEQMSDLEKIETLVNDYDKVLSDVSNEFEAFRNAYLMLKNMVAGNDSIQKLKDEGIVEVMENGDMKFITKEIQTEALENHLNRLEKNIHKFSAVPDLSDENFAGNLSGVAIRFKLFGLETKCIIKERKMEKAIKELVRVLSVPIHVNTGREVDVLNLKVEFSRNVPNNLTEIVDTVTKLDGKVDKETLLSLLPFIDNPKEVLEKLEADKERDRQSTDPYSTQNITEDSNNLFPNLNAQNSPQEALNAQGATIPQPEQ